MLRGVFSAGDSEELRGSASSWVGSLWQSSAVRVGVSGLGCVFQPGKERREGWKKGKDWNSTRGRGEVS